MIDKNTERLLIDTNHWLRGIRSMATQKYLSPYQLCKAIISDCTEALNEIKEFRAIHGENKGVKEIAEITDK